MQKSEKSLSRTSSTSTAPVMRPNSEAASRSSSAAMSTAMIPCRLNTEKRSNRIYEKETAEDPDAIFKHVVKRFQQYPNVTLVRGIVPDTFTDTCPEEISFLHIDMNSAKSEMAVLTSLFDRVTPGGIIIFDDYGWTGYVQQKIAEDEFMAQRNHSILELPTGQGMVIKQA